MKPNISRVEFFLEESLNSRYLLLVLAAKKYFHIFFNDSEHFGLEQ